MSVAKIPSFSSFPDLEAEAGPSTARKLLKQPSNFESFPDLGRERKEKEGRKEHKRKREHREKDRRKDDPERKDKVRDEKKHRDTHSPRRSRERHESRHREREHDRYHEREERKKRKDRKEVQQPTTTREQDEWNFVDERGRTDTTDGVGMFKAERGIESLTAVTYFADRKGDTLNVAYGGLHTHDVPKYKMAGCTSHLFFFSQLLELDIGIYRG